MTKRRRTRAWWIETVQRWRRSGLTAGQFAQRESVEERTLRWWSSQLSRDTRAKHGLAGGEPLEIAISEATSAGGGGVEIIAGEVVVRCAPGADATYVAALVRALSRG
jgi:hypothetical protein